MRGTGCRFSHDGGDGGFGGSPRPAQQCYAFQKGLSSLPF